MFFDDRRDAGRRLAAQLLRFVPEHPVVVALPRGGVPVAVEVAWALGAPLEVLMVRKLGAPGHSEFGVGAVTEDGVVVFDAETARRVGMTQELFESTLDAESQELRRRVATYRRGRPPLDLRDRTVIVVDDGLATGLTDLAAVRALRRRGAARIIVAVPVASQDAVALIGEEADEVISHTIPEDLRGIGLWYRDFSQVSDEEVLALLADPRPVVPVAAVVDERREVAFHLKDATLRGDLTVPQGARGLVLFAHGSGSSRHSSRNRAVARTLQLAGFATLLFDLLAESEEQRRDLVFDIPFLAARLKAVTRWAQEEPATRALPIGYFGASTGAGAALRAAAEVGDAIRAVVSRGGRPDLAGDHLPLVTAPTLLIVGSEDTEVLELNRQAAEQLRAPCHVAVVPGATHLFAEHGTLNEAARLATEWFTTHLTVTTPMTPAGS